MMFFTIYKTTCLLNGKFYIGKHQTMRPDDGYLGSGVHLKRAIKLYGRNAFKKEVLFCFIKESEMDEMEKLILTEDVWRSDDCYNLGPGGEGGPHAKGMHHTDEAKRKISQFMRLRKHSPETKARFKETAIYVGRLGGLANRGKPKSENHKTKLRYAQNLQSRIKNGRLGGIKSKGRKLSDEHKAKLVAAAIRRWSVG